MWKAALISLLSAIFSNGAVAQSSSAQQQFVPGELIVGFHTDADASSFVRNASEVGRKLRISGERPDTVDIRAVGANAVKIKVDMPAGMQGRIRSNPKLELDALQEVAQQIKASNPRVRYAHPNWILGVRLPEQTDSFKSNSLSRQAAPPAAGPNDPIYKNQWHYQPVPAGMNAVGAWNVSSGSREVVVAVLDSGLALDHPDIKNSGNFLPGANLLTSDFRQGNANDLGDGCPAERSPPSWHGTHVAGIIGAVASNNGIAIAGVNWNVTVLPVRVLGPCGGSMYDIADGIRWAAGLPVNGVPLNERRAHVINLSLGGGGECTPEKSGYLLEAIKAARARGSVVVVAAGNEKSDVKNFIPASCPGVISVAAADRNGAISYFSNFGKVTIMAPGGDMRNYVDSNGKAIPNSGLPDGIWSIAKVTTVPANSDGIRVMEGTSQAAPHVAGAIALALAKRPDWRGKPDLIEQKLRASAAPVTAKQCPKEKPCGAGQLDALKLLNMK